jgi:ribose transport system ATP-binding protein
MVAAPKPVPLLDICGLNKSFAAPVLRDFDLSVMPGEVHALVGANGAGKSTLAHILAGLLRPDSGKITFLGQPYQACSRRQARSAGVTLMLQELNVLPTLSVAENLFLPELPSRFGLVNRKKLRAKAREALVRVGLEHLDPDMSAARLGVGQQQLVELAAALAEKCQLLILDEPTAALTAHETEILFEKIHQLRQQGISLIYISHRMDELRRICDRVSVLRDGQHVATLPLSSTNTQELVKLMAGREMPTRPLPHRNQPGAVALSVQQLRVGTAVQDVSFEVREGEILGLSGLVGAGRTEALRAIFGADRRDVGVVAICGREVRIRRPSEAVAAGLAFVPEDRKREGLLLPQGIRVNTTLANLKSTLVHREKELEATAQVIERLVVKCDSVESPVSTLSGGNQQKIVIGRWLLPDSKVLLLDEPTRGIDVPAKEAIYKLLRDLADDGKAIVIVSSELPELMSLCDRIAVMSAGRITQEFLPHEWTLERLTKAAFRGHLTS